MDLYRKLHGSRSINHRKIARVFGEISQMQYTRIAFVKHKCNLLLIFEIKCNFLLKNFSKYFTAELNCFRG